jgi:hypothetical protein
MKVGSKCEGDNHNEEVNRGRTWHTQTAKCWDVKLQFTRLWDTTFTLHSTSTNDARYRKAISSSIKGAGGAVIAQWYSAGLRSGWSGVRVPAVCGNFPLHYRVQSGSGAQPASYPMGTRGSFPGGKATGAWSWPLTPSAEVKNTWSYTSTLICLHGVVLS